MSTTKHQSRAWRWVLGALVLPLAGSAWAAWGGPGCRSCEGASELLGGRNVAVLGVLYYGILLGASLLCGPSVFVYSGVGVAAGIHAGLVSVLIQSQILCVPCIVTAVSAAVALVAAIVAEPANAFRASLILPGAALAVQSWVLLTGAVPAVTQTRASAERVAHDELASAPVERGKVRMMIYTRPDCGYCIELEQDVLPALERRFGARLRVELRSAEKLPGIPTPTIILTGSNSRRMFPGLPPKEELERAIALVMGEDHGSETVLEKSR